MNIKVYNEKQILTYQEPNKHILISIASTDKDRPEIPLRSSRVITLYLTFHDLDKPIPSGNTVLFDKVDAKKIASTLKFYAKEIDTVLCQCEAGVSRSMGLAAALAKYFNNDDTEYFKKGIPNMRVYHIMLEALYYKDDIFRANGIIVKNSVKNYWISCNKFAIAVKVDKDTIINAPPLVAKFKGRTIDELMMWINKNFRKVEVTTLD